MNRVKVKICGVNQLQNALDIAELGIDMLGLNFYAPSPRSVSVELAQAISASLRQRLGKRCPALVGLFVNESLERMEQVVAQVGLDFVQLSGDETPETLSKLGGIAFKALQAQSVSHAETLATQYAAYAPRDEDAPKLILDAYHPSLRGGTGEMVSAEIVRAVQAQVPRLMLAGGLTPDNVGERVAQFRPWGVDIASGVESRTAGIKDIAKVAAVLRAVGRG